MFLFIFQKLNLNQIYEDFNLLAFVGYYFFFKIFLESLYSLQYFLYKGQSFQSVY